MGIAENTIKKKNNKIKKANITVESFKDFGVRYINITIDQMIEPQMRPRVGGFKNIYDPLQTYKKYLRKKVEEELIKKNIKIEIDEDKYIESNIILKCEPPKTFSKRKKFDSIRNKYKFNKKPDIDNCVKTIYDSFEGIFFFNDSQIIKEILEKQYSTKEETIIEFRIYDQYESKGRLSKEDLDNMKPIYKEYLEKE